MAERVDVPAGRVDQTTDYPGIFRRVSWGAIFAGVFIAVAVQMMLSLLGAAVGLSVISPAQGEGSPEALGTGAAIWWVISTIIALFVGGWVAAHLAGVFRRLDGGLHGLVTWSLATVIALFMLGSTLGALSGAAAGTRQGQGALSSLTPQISQSFRQEGRVERVRDRIENQARRLVEQGGKVKGDNIEDAQDTVADAVGEVLDDPSQENRQDAIQALTENTNLNQDQAKSRLDRWIRNFNEAKPEYREAGTPEAKKAERAVTIASRTAWATFAMFILGAAAAFIGGWVGSPTDWREGHDRPTTAAERGDRRI